MGFIFLIQVTALASAAEQATIDVEGEEVAKVGKITVLVKAETGWFYWAPDSRVNSELPAFSGPEQRVGFTLTWWSRPDGMTGNRAGMFMDSGLVNMSTLRGHRGWDYDDLGSPAAELGGLYADVGFTLELAEPRGAIVAPVVGFGGATGWGTGKLPFSGTSFVNDEVIDLRMLEMGPWSQIGVVTGINVIFNKSRLAAGLRARWMGGAATYRSWSGQSGISESGAAIGAATFGINYRLGAE